jgi:hypothetical protein
MGQSVEKPSPQYPTVMPNECELENGSIYQHQQELAANVE